MGQRLIRRLPEHCNNSHSAPCGCSFTYAPAPPAHGRFCLRLLRPFSKEAVVFFISQAFLEEVRSRKKLSCLGNSPGQPQGPFVASSTPSPITNKTLKMAPQETSDRSFRAQLGSKGDHPVREAGLATSLFSVNFTFRCCLSE